jgi:hypothetical protein
VGVLVLAVFLLLLGPAELGWTEHHVEQGGHVAMTFVVEELEVSGGRWSAHVAIRNDRWLRMRVVRDFALLVDGKPYRAASFAPRLPRVLAMKGGWRGTIRGRAPVAPGARLRLLLGEYRVVIAPALRLRHVTRHTLVVDDGA